MTRKTQLDVPAGMQRISRRFERWRRSHRGRLPIPEGLWASAAAVAREHGVFRTAKVLYCSCHGAPKKSCRLEKPSLLTRLTRRMGAVKCYRISARRMASDLNSKTMATAGALV